LKEELTKKVQSSMADKVQEENRKKELKQRENS